MSYQKHSDGDVVLCNEKDIADKKGSKTYSMEWAKKGVGKLQIKDIDGTKTMVLRTDAAEGGTSILLLNLALGSLSKESIIRSGKIGLMCSCLPNPPLHGLCVLCNEPHADRQASNHCKNGCWGADGFKVNTNGMHLIRSLALSFQKCARCLHVIRCICAVCG